MAAIKRVKGTVGSPHRGPTLRGLSLLALLAAAPALADTAYVTCQNGEEIGVIDIATGTETARWPLPGQPAGIAVRAGEIFTVSPGSKTVRRLDAATGATLAEVTLDGGPTGVALDAARDRLFVSDWYAARLWVLDADTLQIQATLDTGTSPAGIALSDDGRFLASADKDADRVTLFDAHTLAPLHAITVGQAPFGLRFAPDGRLFVGNVASNDVSVIDPASGTVTATVPVGERPYGVAFAAGRAFVTDQYANTLSVIALADLQPVATLDVGEYPEGIDATADGNRIVLANWFDNTVSIVDPQALTVVSTVDTCDGPRAFGTFLLGGGTSQ